MFRPNYDGRNRARIPMDLDWYLMFIHGLYTNQLIVVVGDEVSLITRWGVPHHYWLESSPSSFDQHLRAKTIQVYIDYVVIVSPSYLPPFLLLMPLHMGLTGRYNCLELCAFCSQYLGQLVYCFLLIHSFSFGGREGGTHTYSAPLFTVNSRAAWAIRMWL